MSLRWWWQGEPTPPLLYKFYPAERADVVRSFLVRFSQVAALNDPFEFLVSIKPGALHKSARQISRSVTNPISLACTIIKQLYDSFFRAEDLKRIPIAIRAAIFFALIIASPIIVCAVYAFFNRNMQNIIVSAIDDVEDAVLNNARRGLILIFSCSQKWDSVPMWAHYAGNHSGFALGIDPQRAFLTTTRNKKSSEQTYIPAQIVKYQKSAPKIRKIDNLMCFTTTKLSHWAYEKEWRFTRTPDEAAERGSFIGGHELILFPLNPESVKEVIFGARCSFEIAEAVMSSLRSSGMEPELFHIIDSPDYGFKRQPLKDIDELKKIIETPASLPTIRSHRFGRMESALSSMVLEAEENRFFKWIRRSGRKNK